MKKTLLNRWTFSNDEEYWDNDDYPTKEEAIEAGKEAYGGSTGEFGEFVIGQLVDVKFEEQDIKQLDLANQVFSNLSDVLYDEVGGNGADNWYYHLNIADENSLNAQLAKTVIDWITKHDMQNSSFTVENVEVISEE